MRFNIRVESTHSPIQPLGGLHICNSPALFLRNDASFFGKAVEQGGKNNLSCNLISVSALKMNDC